MAAYATTVVISPQKRPDPIGGFPGLKIVAGRVTITNYNTTLAEITAISKKFSSPPEVICGAPNSAHTAHWVAASKSIKCFVTSTGAEVATDVTTIGVIPFIAIGPG